MAEKHSVCLMVPNAERKAQTNAHEDCGDWLFGDEDGGEGQSSEETVDGAEEIVVAVDGEEGEEEGGKQG